MPNIILCTPNFLSNLSLAIQQSVIILCIMLMCKGTVPDMDTVEEDGWQQKDMEVCIDCHEVSYVVTMIIIGVL